MVSFGCSNNSKMKGSSNTNISSEEELSHPESPSQGEIRAHTDVKKIVVNEIEKPMDILFVIDSSTSMQKYQIALGFQMENLVEKLGSDKDWKIAVTSTVPASDATKNKGCIDDVITSTEYANNREGTKTKLRTFIGDISDGGGYEEGLFKILEAMNLVNMETYNKVREKDPSYTIQNAQEVLNPPGYKRCNKESGKDWFRTNANLSVIILSDEDQCSMSSNNGSSPACIAYKDSTDSYIRKNTKYSRIACTQNYASYQSPCLDLEDDEDVKKFINTFKNVKVSEGKGENGEGENYSESCQDSNLCLGDYLTKVPKDQRCLSISNDGTRKYWEKGDNVTRTIYSMRLGQVFCPDRGNSAPLSSYDLGMTQRRNSVDIFSKYISTMNKNVKIYGILYPKNAGDDKLSGIDRSWVYKETIKKFGNTHVEDITLAENVCSSCKESCTDKILETVEGVNSCRVCQINNGCTETYAEILNNISTNIEKDLTVTEISVSSIPENITEIALGKLDATGKFVLIKNIELGKDIYESNKGPGTFELASNFNLEGATHLQIKYNTVEF